VAIPGSDESRTVFEPAGHGRAERAAAVAPGFLAQAPWRRLADAGTAEEYAAAWLDLQCSLIEGVRAAVVVLGKPAAGPYAPVAYWPEGGSGSGSLAAAAEVAMDERRGVVQSHGAGEGGTAPHDDVAWPVLVDGQLCGVVALEIAGRGDAELRTVMRQLQWGVAWLEVLVRQKTFATRDRLVAVLELIATCLEHERFQAAAGAFVTDLASRLGCERVSLGFVGRNRTRVQALSNTAKFGKLSNLVRDIGAGMDEALDQGRTVVYPPPEDTPEVLTRVHAVLAERHGAGAICTVPLFAEGRALGGLTLERRAEEPFDRRTVELCEHVGSLVGPLLDVHRREDRWLGAKAWDAFVGLLARVIGPRHFGLKLATLLLAALVAFFAVAEGDYRIAADASLEGTVERTVVAPLDGYVTAAHARAGDLVNEGEPLATLDDRDLRLERVKWASEREQLLREYRNALADHDRPKVSILSAQIDQAEAQVALLDDQIARTRIAAPFDGLVVTGDLTQSMGAPVERGDVLFEVAPLDEYRILLEVDERDIADVAEGQSGRIALSGLPGRPLPFSVQKVTPVSTAEEGRNFFRVEARLEQRDPALRPGMEGVGKIHVDRRKLLWIWTHDIADWLRLFAWRWIP